MPLIIELLTLSELAALEATFGPITVIAPALIQSLGETPEPEGSAERHEYYRQMMETNMGVVAR